MKVIIKQPGQPAFSQDVSGLSEIESYTGSIIKWFVLPCGMVLLTSKEIDEIDTPFNFLINGKQIFGPAVFAAFDGINLIGLSEFQEQAVLGYFNFQENQNTSKDVWTFIVEVDGETDERSNSNT